MEILTQLEPQKTSLVEVISHQFNGDRSLEVITNVLLVAEKNAELEHQIQSLLFVEDVA